MNLKKRIITSMLILVFMPVVMLGIGVLCFMAYQGTYSQQKYGVNSTPTESLTNPAKVLDRYTKGSYEKMLMTGSKDPDRLVDEEYLEELTREMDSRYAFIVVRRGDEYIYIGDEDLFSRINTDFPEYGKQMPDNQLIYLASDIPVILKQIDFVTGDGQQCSAFIVIKMTKVIPQIKAMATQIVFQVLVVVLCTAVVLIIWLYKSTLKPLNALSKAAKRIAQGNLDFEITDYTDDEIGTLCSDFETMRKQLKENIDKQQLYEKESRELISNISHDLKTPLTAIKGYSEGLIDGVAVTREKQEKYLETIYNKANDMTALVDELSLYAKLGMNAVPYDFAHINANDYFDECVDEISVEMDMRKIKVVYQNNLCEDTSIIADAEQLGRVISNIVNNSMKYMDKEYGKIEIRLDEDDTCVKVSIEDNGKGIVPEDIDKIFDRFYRTDASRNSNEGGTGLGLAIAKKIIDEHGGRIWAKSSEGVGTEICFTLAKEVDVQMPENDIHESAQGATTRNERKLKKEVKMRRKKRNMSV